MTAEATCCDKDDLSIECNFEGRIDDFRREVILTRLYSGLFEDLLNLVLVEQGSSINHTFQVAVQEVPCPNHTPNSH